MSDHYREAYYKIEGELRNAIDQRDEAKRRAASLYMVLQFVVDSRRLERQAKLKAIEAIDAARGALKQFNEMPQQKVAP